MRDQEDQESKNTENGEEEKKQEEGSEKIGSIADMEETIEELRTEVAHEEKRREKALRHQYKYKEVFGSIFYSDVPAKPKTVKGIDGAALTQMNLDKTITLENLIKGQLPD